MDRVDCSPRTLCLGTTFNRPSLESILSAEAAPFVPLAESAEVLEAAEALADCIVVRGQNARGIALPTQSVAMLAEIGTRLNGCGAAVSAAYL